jgi:hypothetical protein
VGIATILKDIAGGLAAPVLTHLSRRAELKQAKFEAQLKFEQAIGDRKAELVKAGLTADMNWEMEFAKQAERSWKDEYTLLVVSVPAVLAFVPHYAPIVAMGFDALSKTPIWYQTMFVSIFLATYGIRFWRRTQSDT